MGILHYDIYDNLSQPNHWTKGHTSSSKVVSEAEGASDC